MNRSYFFSPHEGARKYAEFYQKKSLCVDQDNLEIYGDFNSEKAKQFNVQLVKCTGGEANGCKSETEIMAFFRNKWIMMYYNQIRFDSF